MCLAIAPREKTSDALPPRPPLDPRRLLSLEPTPENQELLDSITAKQPELPPTEALTLEPLPGPPETADQVDIGSPPPPEEGRRPSLSAILERVEWWAELFELPCVGFAGALDEVEPLARAGADFIAVGDCLFSDTRGCAAAAAEVARRVTDAEVPG